MFGITLWWYYVPFNFHTSSYCNQRVLSLFLSFFVCSLLSPAYDRPLASTRRTRRGTRPPATSLPDNPPSPRPDALVCSSVWDFGRLQTSQNFLCPSDHTRHSPFFLFASVGFIRQGVQPVRPSGAFRHVRPVTGWPPSSSDVHHRLIIVRRTRVRSPQLRRHR